MPFLPRNISVLYTHRSNSWGEPHHFSRLPEAEEKEGHILCVCLSLLSYDNPHLRPVKKEVVRVAML